MKVREGSSNFQLSTFNFERLLILSVEGFDGVDHGDDVFHGGFHLDVVNGIEDPVIVIARADKAARPFRRGGRKAKRTHVYLEARQKTKLDKKKK